MKFSSISWRCYFKKKHCFTKCTFVFSSFRLLQFWFDIWYTASCMFSKQYLQFVKILILTRTHIFSGVLILLRLCSPWDLTMLTEIPGGFFGQYLHPIIASVMLWFSASWNIWKDSLQKQWGVLTLHAGAGQSTIQTMVSFVSVYSSHLFWSNRYAAQMQSNCFHTVASQI